MRDGGFEGFRPIHEEMVSSFPLSGRGGHKRSSVDILGRDWPIRTYGAAFCCNARLRALLYWPRSLHRGQAHEALEIRRAAQW